MAANNLNPHRKTIALPSKRRLVIDKDFDGWAWRWTAGKFAGRFARALYYSRADCAEDNSVAVGKGKPVPVKLVEVESAATPATKEE